MEVGFKKLNEIGNELVNSSIDTVNPKITQSNFIQLIQDKWGNIEDSSLSTEIIDDTNLFMDMILTRKNRNFASLITKKNVTLGEAITLAFKDVSKDDPSRVEKVLQIFEEIVKRDSYTKGIGQTNVGKAEIALAMFFGDCKLPEHGDIQMGNKLIEVKGAGGTITPRMGQRSWLAYGTDKSASWKKYSDRVKNKNEVNSLLTQVGVNPDELEFSNISDVIAKIEKAKRKQKSMVGKLESLKFAVIFAIMFNNYVTKEKISCFWLFNTAKDKKT